MKRSVAPSRREQFRRLRRCADSSVRTVVVPTGDDSARIVDLVCGFWRNAKTLRMHAMLGDVIRSHRQKCSRSDVQRHERVRNFA